MAQRKTTEVAPVAPLPDNPFARSPMPSHVSAGAVTIEQERAIAEAQGKLVVAKRFPRDEAQAFDRVIAACSRIGLAEEAQYSFPRGGKTVSGASIRLAEELARCWGNVEYGLRELSRRDGESELEAYAWDLQTNVYSSQKFTVKHIRDTRGGGQTLTDERDIYEVGANMGARRMRARILAVLPGDLEDAAVEQCLKTQREFAALPDRMQRLVVEFQKLGVTKQMIERRAECKIAELTPDQIVEFGGIYKAIRDNMGRRQEWFPEPVSAAAAAVNAAVAPEETSRPEQPEPAPEPAPEPVEEPPAPDPDAPTRERF